MNAPQKAIRLPLPPFSLCAAAASLIVALALVAAGYMQQAPGDMLTRFVKGALAWAGFFSLIWAAGKFTGGAKGPVRLGVFALCAGMLIMTASSSMKLVFFLLLVEGIISLWLALGYTLFARALGNGPDRFGLAAGAVFLLTGLYALYALLSS